MCPVVGISHVAVVAARRVDHQLQRRGDVGTCFLKVEFIHQISRALDVGEQGVDQLALGVECF